MIKLKECQYCKSEINENSLKCPKCGEWLNQSLFKSQKTTYLILLGAISAMVYFTDDRPIPPKKQEPVKVEVPKFVSADHHQLKFVWHKVENLEGNEKYIIGEIKNDGEDSFASLALQASFYDNDKNLIKLGQTNINSKIGPGETKKFEITYSCGSCDIKKIFATYDLEVLNGNIL